MTVSERGMEESTMVILDIRPRNPCFYVGIACGLRQSWYPTDIEAGL